MRLLGLTLAAIILFAVSGCYWGYYHYGDYPYYSRGYYEAYESPSVGITYYDPYYPSYYYHDYYGYSPYYYTDAYYAYPYRPSHYYRGHAPARYYYGSDGRYYRRPRSSSSGGKSFLGKFRSSGGSSRSRGSFLRKFR